MSHLDALVGGQEAFCDGGPHDQAFLTRLSQAAGMRPAFTLGDLEALCIRAGLDDPGRLRFAGLLRESGAAVGHRAGPDALRLLRAVAAAADRHPSIVVDTAK